MKKLFFVPFVLALLAIVACILMMGADPGSFLGPSAIVIVFAGAIFLLRTHYSFAEMGHAFRCAGRNYPASAEELRVAREFFRSARTTFIGTGLVGLVMGFMRVLEGADKSANYSTDALLGFSIALITIFYGLATAVFLIEPFASAIRKKLAQQAAD